MSTDQIDQLYTYVQEHCLWQFFSRTWDRQENIDGILTAAADLLTGEAPKRETPMERLFYADAIILAADFKKQFPWIMEASSAEVRQLLDGVKAKLTDIAITHSKNGELNAANY